MTFGCLKFFSDRLLLSTYKLLEWPSRSNLCPLPLTLDTFFIEFLKDLQTSFYSSLHVLYPLLSFSHLAISKISTQSLKLKCHLFFPSAQAFLSARWLFYF